jgi:hypothetical protein
MIPLVIRLPLDPTGLSQDNLIVREPHTISTRRVRAIATKSGAFFSKSLALYDDTTGQKLTENQYYAAEMYQLPSKRYGEEICAIVMITDPSVSTKVSVSYQALGDIYSTSQEAIIAQIERLQIDTRPVAWGDIIGKPDGFKPSAHLHDAGDIYGFEYVVFALDRIADAIMLGDAASHDAIYRYIDNMEATLRALIAQSSVNLAAHINNNQNPHGVTPAQLNVFTKPETQSLVSQSVAALAGSINARIDAEVATLNAADFQTNARITGHIGNTSNPHNLTAAQINAWTTVEAQNAINQAVAASSLTINARITQEVAILSSTINANNTAVSGKIDGIQRGHLAITTSGTSAAMRADCNGTLSTYFAASRTVKIRFHTATSGAAVTLALDGTGVTANLAQYTPDGNMTYATVAAGQISDVYWNGGSELIVLDPLPPLVKNVIDVFPSRPAAKTTDVILVADLGMMTWKSVGGHTGYVTADIGKVFYDAAQSTGRNAVVDLNGTWLPKAGYPALWAWVNANGLVTTPQFWTAGTFLFNDINADSFAVPDLRNVFIRGAGTNSDDGSTRWLGTFQANANAGHTHAASTDASGDHYHGTGWGESQQSDARYGVYSFTRGPGSGKTDYDNYDFKTSTNGNHSHGVTVAYTGGSESRPNNVALLPRMYCL